METKIPGIVAHHAIITPECRKLQRGVLSSELEAFEEAVNRIRDEYKLVIHYRDDGFNAHLVLTIEEPVSRARIAPAS